MEEINYMNVLENSFILQDDFLHGKNWDEFSNQFKNY